MNSQEDQDAEPIALNKDDHETHMRDLAPVTIGLEMEQKILGKAGHRTARRHSRHPQAEKYNAAVMTHYIVQGIREVQRMVHKSLTDNKADALSTATFISGDEHHKKALRVDIAAEDAFRNVFRRHYGNGVRFSVKKACHFIFVAKIARALVRLY